MTTFVCNDCMAFNRPFYQYSSHIDLIHFKEYHGMPRGHKQDPLYSLSIRNMVCHCIFSGKKAIIIMKHCTTIFFPLQSILGKL